MWIKIAIFLGLILLDYITGIISAYIKKELSSKIGLQGLIKKGGICLGFVGCMLIELFLINSGYLNERLITTVYLLMYSCNEFISIFENLDECGVKLPTKIKDVINNITGKSDNGQS